MLKKLPVKGTNDYLPAEVAIRDAMQSEILRVYTNNGFQRIQTPAIEDARNLDNSDGGENLNLIFKILKRGKKLEESLAKGAFTDLADLGLRYDLTLPLSRYFAHRKEELMLPFKVIQMDRVYRAERPQKGRLREFVQCDIDIVGEAAPTAEVELILTTCEALTAVGLTDYKVVLNDRRILLAALTKMGFPEAELDSVCITFDKLDKIGVAGVTQELTEKGFDQAAIQALAEVLEVGGLSLERLAAEGVAPEATERLSYIMEQTEKLLDDARPVVFDLSLVRGQGYYTGTVFEIASTAFKGALAGGGRYDNLIGRFTGQDVPAVGFSIGFERIFSLLQETGDYRFPLGRKKAVLIYEGKDFAAAWQAAAIARLQYDVLLYQKPRRLGKTLNELKSHGYRLVRLFGQDDDFRALE